MTIRFSEPQGVPAPEGRYSHLAVVPAGSDMLFLAGQVGREPGGAISPDVTAQFVQALRNILAILASEGCGPEHIVRLTTFLVEPIDLAALKDMRLNLLGEVKPTTTLVYVPRLATPEFLVEIEAIAARPAR